ncbi:hypothetical protein HY450_03425 [Candidatus Pacearchaeota archaeon]|nr:hypothetical protein [Candidatus Pacearchaeota archaeon]
MSEGARYGVNPKVLKEIDERTKESPLVELTEVPFDGIPVEEPKMVLGVIDSSCTPYKFVPNNRSLMEKTPNVANAYLIGEAGILIGAPGSFREAAVQFYQIPLYQIPTGNKEKKEDEGR